MRYRVILILALLFVCSLGNATEQILEEISIGDGLFTIYERPLSQLISKENFIELYDPPKCSAVWRGYLGTWTIRDNKLYLNFLERDPCNLTADSRNWEEKQFDFKKIIPGKDFSLQEIEASWYSGDITIPLGEFRVVEFNEKKELEFQIIVYKVNKGNIESRKIKYVSDKSISNKIKNVNASEASSDAARTRRPLQRR